MSRTKATGHHSGPDKLGRGLFGDRDAADAFSLFAEAELLRGKKQILCSDIDVLFSWKNDADKLGLRIFLGLRHCATSLAMLT